MKRVRGTAAHGPTVLASCSAALVLSVVAGELTAAASTPPSVPAGSTAAAVTVAASAGLIPGADAPQTQSEQVFSEYRAAHPVASAAARKAKLTRATTPTSVPVSTPRSVSVPRQAPAPVRTVAAGGSSSASMAGSVLARLNSERSAHGLAALTMNSDLLSSAHRHNLAMAAANTMSHQEPGEATFSTRITDAGYDWSACAENIGWNSEMTTSGALALEVAMYAEGPGGGHYQNIVGQYQSIGIDVWLDTAHHRLWLTEDFGAAA